MGDGESVGVFFCLFFSSFSFVRFFCSVGRVTHFPPGARQRDHHCGRSTKDAVGEKRMETENRVRSTVPD